MQSQQPTHDTAPAGATSPESELDAGTIDPLLDAPTAEVATAEVDGVPEPAVTEPAAAETTAAPVNAAPRPFRWEQTAWLWLVAILILGAWFRFTGINWDAYTHLHPDERFLTDVASRLSTSTQAADGSVESIFTNPLLYLRTSESPLNPYNKGFDFYVYGNFFMTVTRIVAEGTQAICDRFGDVCPVYYVGYDGIHFVGRALSALVDLVAVAFAFLIGRKLYDWRVGLLGALLSAAAVMQIQQAHFFTADNWAAAFSVISIYFAVRASEDATRKRWWILFGIGLGLAVANRINVAPLAGMAAVAAVIWLTREVGSWGALRTSRGYEQALIAVVGVLLAAVVSIVTFRLAMPYAFADATIARQVALETGADPNGFSTRLQSVIGFNPRWSGNMEEIQRLQQPDQTFPPALQWTDRTPLLFPLANIVLWGMGILAGVTAWLAFVWAAWRISRARADWQAHLIPVIWIGGYFVFMGIRWVKSIRYFLPLYPILLLLAAWALITLWDMAQSRRRKALVATLSAVVVVFTLAWANSFVNIYRQPLTRVAASDWMRDNVRSGATLVYEAGGVALERQLPLRLHSFAQPYQATLDLPVAANATALRFNYVYAEAGTPDSAIWRVEVRDSNGTLLYEEDVAVTFSAERAPVTIPLPNIPLSAPVEGAGRPLITVAPVQGAIAIAETSIIATEHWDDPLPVRRPGFDPYGQYYTGITDEVLGINGQLPVTWPDTREKRDGFYRWLESADYIVLSSQRGVWSTARLPLTYPVTNAYYAGLFDGSLGFEMVGEFHADWSLGPLKISDTGGRVGWGSFPSIGWPDPPWWAVEEAFSVYDHPPVWIFAKTERYSAETARSMLGSIDLTQQVSMNPGQATAAPNGLTLSDEAFATQTANGTFRTLFPLNNPLNTAPLLGAAVWWLAMVVLGWLAFPLTFTVLRGLPSRGYAVARILGLLLVAYFGWLMASAGWLDNTRSTYVVGVALLAAAGVMLYARQRQAINAFVRDQRRYILLVELVGVALFIVGLLIRLGNPDVWDVIWGGEKPMDLSYFNATLKSTTFPPYDPWYAGGFINYYYFGFVFVGALTKLLGIMPTIAYNLSVALLYALTGLGAFSLAADLVAWRRKKADSAESPALFNGQTALAGGAAVVMCLMLGNLGQLGVILGAAQRMGDPSASRLGQLIGGLSRLLAGEPAPLYTGDWFWLASRAISVPPGEAAPITEFPFFTFLYGDLHAHMIALPLTLLALAWALGVALWPTGDGEQFGRIDTVLLWLIGGLTIGVLYPANSWDWPTYLVIGVLAVALRSYRRAGTLGVQAIGQAVVEAVILVGLTFALFLPFRQSFGAGYQTFELWNGARTGLADYVTIYGLFLFLTLTHLARELRAWTASLSVSVLEKLEPYALLIAASVILFLALCVVAVLQGVPVALLALPIVVIAGLLGLQAELPASRRSVLILISAAYFLTLLVEVVIVPGTVGRMNTVFKFYMQVWVLLSVTLGAALAWAWPSVVRGWGRPRRVAWQTVLGVLVFVAALYPPLAFNAKSQSRVAVDAPRTLDGMAFMESAEYNDQGTMVSLKPDHDAIQWMYANIDGSPVIAEAYSPNYYRQAGNRIAMYTGLPSIIGWSGHQSQQRVVVPGNAIDRRINDVNTLYNTTNDVEAATILLRYGVSYVYVGPLERVYYAADGLAKFDRMADAGQLTAVYSAPQVTIYAVNSDVLASEQAERQRLSDALLSDANRQPAQAPAADAPLDTLLTIP